MPRAYRKRTAPALAPYKNVQKGGNKTRQKSSPQSLHTDMVATKALEMRIAGKEFREIATALGLKSASAAYEAMQRAFTLGVIIPNNELRMVEVERLEKLHAELWPLAVGENAEKDTELRLQIIDRVLKVGAQRQKVAGLEQAPETNQQDRANKLADIERAIAAYIRGMVEAKQPEPTREAAIIMLCQVNPAFAADVKGLLRG